MKKYLAALMCAMLIGLCGCAGTTDGRPLVAVTVAPEAELVSAVAGEDYDVTVLIPPGSDPESYELTMKQRAGFADADVYFTIGVPAEEASLLPAVSEKTAVVSLSEAARAVYPELSLGDGRDPHVWLSAKRMAVMTDAVADTLSALRPDRAEVYKKNADAYKERLSAASDAAAETLSALGKKDIIVYHPAFGYFCDEYGLTMHALEEEGKEADPRRLSDMIDFARKEGIRAVFFQAESAPGQAEAFAREIDGKAIELAPLATDYIDNLCHMAELIREAMQ